jgi:hypothetical protein
MDTFRVARLVEEVPEVRYDRTHLLDVGVQSIELVAFAHRIEIEVLVPYALETGLRVQAKSFNDAATSQRSARG